MENKETRSINLEDVELRAVQVDEGKTKLVGYPIKYNVWSDDLGGFRERIRPGAAAKALLKSDVRLLYNHQTNQLPLGRTPKTLRLVEENRGVKMENDLPDTQFARDLVVSIERKDVNGMSFGFNVAENGDEWKEKDGVVSRTINEIDEIFDVSVVVFPAYPQAKVSTRAIDKAGEIKKASETRGGGQNEEATLLDDEQKRLEIDMLDL